MTISKCVKFISLVYFQQRAKLQRIYGKINTFENNSAVDMQVMQEQELKCQCSITGTILKVKMSNFPTEIALF